LRLVFAGLFSSLGCLAAEAAVFEFAYETALMSCFDTSCRGRAPITRAGTITFDESLLPGGTLAGTRVSFFQELDEETEDDFRAIAFRRYEIAGPRGTFTGAWRESSFDDWDEAPFFTFDGFLEEFLGFTVFESELTLSFDAETRVAEWFGFNFNSDVNEDPQISDTRLGRFFDTDDGFGSDAQGTWTRTRPGGPPPAPVPLPAAGAMLAATLAGLGIARRPAGRGRRTGG
jgi:hypothetical protein